MSTRGSVSAITLNLSIIVLSVEFRFSSTHSIYPASTFAKIPNSSGKLIIGVPDSPMILLFLASVNNL